MAARRRYTRTEKAAAVGRAEATSLEQASQDLDIPKSTLDYWRKHPDFAPLRTKTREDVAEQFWAAIQVGVDQVTSGLLDSDTPLRDKATTLGILYDKHALMTGAATTRSESRDITGTLDDHERKDLSAAIREHLAVRRGVGAGVAEAPEDAGPGD